MPPARTRCPRRGTLCRRAPAGQATRRAARSRRPRRRAARASAAASESPTVEQEVVRLLQSRRLGRRRAAAMGLRLPGPCVLHLWHECPGGVRSRDGTAVQARRRRGALAAHVGGRGPLRRARRRRPADVRRRAPAAERHRRSPHGARNGAHAGRRAHALEADAGLQLPLPAGLRPRGHLHAVGGREGAGGRGPLAAGGRARAVRRAGLGLAPPLRADDHDPVPAHGRLDGLPARADDDGRGLHARRHAPLRPPLGARLAVPRPPDRQLVPVPPIVAVRTSSSTTRRWTTSSSTSATRSWRATGRGHDRDRAAGDDPRGRRRRGAPRGRALPRLRGPRGDRALRGAARARDRRRARRARVRDGRAEGDAWRTTRPTSRSAARTACPSRP